MLKAAHLIAMSLGFLVVVAIIFVVVMLITMGLTE